MHGFTVMLPEDYRCHGSDITALSFFATAADQNDGGAEERLFGKYAKIAKVSSDTALRDIRDLLARGIFVQNPGGGRSTNYRLATVDELQSARGRP